MKVRLIPVLSVSNKNNLGCVCIPGFYFLSNHGRKPADFRRGLCAQQQTADAEGHFGISETLPEPIANHSLVFGAETIYNKRRKHKKFAKGYLLAGCGITNRVSVPTYRIYGKIAFAFNAQTINREGNYDR